MNLLAFDTSTEFLSLALTANDQTFLHAQLAGAAASQLILSQIQALLDAANIQLNQLDGIVFGAGPGAFTGVRVACGVAQGLGFGAKLPVLGINTLHAMAQTTGAQKVIVCQDARMGEIYFAALQKQGDVWLEIVPTCLLKSNVLPNIIGSDWVAIGSGWVAFKDALETHFANNLTVLPFEFQNLTVLPFDFENLTVFKCQKSQTTAEAMLELAQPMFLAGQAQPASEARPLYIRNRVALTTQERAEGVRL